MITKSILGPNNTENQASERHILGIAGGIGVGKDTIAEYIAKKYGLRTRAFADDLKNWVAGLFGWGYEHMYGDLKGVVDPKWNISPRKALQILGTEGCRALCNDIWLIKMQDWIDHFLPPTDGLIITDIRFENEASFVRNLGGNVIHVTGPSRGSAIASQSDKRHASEQRLIVEKGDFEISNRGALAETFKNIDEMLEDLGMVPVPTAIVTPAADQDLNKLVPGGEQVTDSGVFLDDPEDQAA